MRKLGFILVILLGISTSVLAQSISIKGPNTETLTEGKKYPITWNATGVKTVVVTAKGKLIAYPGQNRGSFNRVIVKKTPASRQRAMWKVPFLDTREVRLFVKGYNSSGKQVAQSSKLYQFRPIELGNRKVNGIYVDFSNENHQRLYVMKDNRITHAYLASGGRSRDFSPRNVHPKRGHDHAGVFKVLSKEPNHWSRMYDVNMTHAMRFWGGHYIHGTSPSEYHKLGRAASSGCVRLHPADARELYSMTPIGTRVEIIGPNQLQKSVS